MLYDDYHRPVINNLPWRSCVLPSSWPVPPPRLASARCRLGGVPRRVRRERLLAPSWSR